MIPSQQVQYKGVTQTTNRFGMRDRDYEPVKAPDTLRIALLGDSHSKGSGVRDEETFENVVEDRLNREPAATRFGKYEILNFSVGGYGPLCRLAILEGKVGDFAPDAVVYEGIDDFTWVVTELANAADRGIEIPFDLPQSVMQRASVTGDTPRIVAEQRLRPHAEELVQWVYARFAEHCRSHNIAAYATFLPRPEVLPEERGLLDRQMALAKDAGLEVLDVSRAYADVKNVESLWLAKWDRHPNAEGNRLLAEALYARIRQQVLPRFTEGG
jgi:hypothetical protein